MTFKVTCRHSLRKILKVENSMCVRDVNVFEYSDTERVEVKYNMSPFETALSFMMTNTAFTRHMKLC